MSESETPDPDDIAVQKARELAGESIEFLVSVLQDKQALTADRIQAARHVLEVAGCLSL